MNLALAIALQAAVPSSPIREVPADFDVSKVKPADPARSCGSQRSDEIVVCGRRPGNGSYPLEEMAKIFERDPLKAETSIGGGATARAYVESVEMPGGQRSKRFMIGTGLKF